MEGNYEALANAIIIQAVKDFRAAYKRHLICYYNRAGKTLV